MKDSLFWSVIISLIWFAHVSKQRENIKLKQMAHKSVYLISFAKSNLGKPYKYGETGPVNFDCSGFVYRVYQESGFSIPRSSLAQSDINGSKLSREELDIGDMVFFDTSLKGRVNHSGIYLGDDRFIHASSGKAYSVTISDLNGWYKDKFKWGKRIHADK